MNEVGRLSKGSTILKALAVGLTCFAISCGPEESVEPSTPVKLEPAGPNLIKNASFEETAEGMPAYWWPHLTPEVSNDPGKAHTGNAAVRVGKAFLSQAVKVEPGKTYSLGHYTRSDAARQAARLQVNFGDSSGKTLDVQIKVVSAGSSWQWNEFAVKAPSGATTAVIFVQPHENGDVWYDDVVFCVGGPALKPR